MEVEIFSLRITGYFVHIYVFFLFLQDSPGAISHQRGIAPHLWFFGASFRVGSHGVEFLPLGPSVTGDLCQSLEKTPFRWSVSTSGPLDVFA